MHYKAFKALYCKMPPDTYQFFLPGHKANKFFKGNQIIAQCSDALMDPYKPFLTYLKSHDSLFPYNPELWLRDDGTVPIHLFLSHASTPYLTHQLQDNPCMQAVQHCLQKQASHHISSKQLADGSQIPGKSMSTKIQCSFKQ
jgi:hypothetical protein